MIISVQNQKGGVGKTTLAIHISHALCLLGYRVLLIDADPQGSARDWAASRQGEPLFSVMGIDRPSIHKEIPLISPNYDHILIDGPPRVTDLARSAIVAADLVLVPVQPSPYDVWAAKEVIDLIKEASIFRESLKSVFVVNRKIANTAIGRDVNEALASYQIPVLKSQITQRVSFAESAGTGQTVLEIEPNGQASQEIKAVVNELMEYAK
jgi:chromosome partitioning protein